MTKRTPLPLLIIRLPYEAAKLILHAIGLITYLPIYIYLLVFSRFLFSKLFETSQAFYIIFTIPRAIASLGAFILAAGEIFLIYTLLKQYLEFDSDFAFYVTLAAVLVVILFSFRFGYTLMFNKLKFPRLSSVKTHLKLVFYGIFDLVSAMFTLLTILMIFRAKEICKYQFQPTERKYFWVSLYNLVCSIYDILALIGWVVLLVLPWRFSYTRRQVKRANSEEKKLWIVIAQAILVFLDLVFIPLFVIALINPFLKGRILLAHMSKLSVVSWHRLIFQQFIHTLLDVPSFVCLIFGCLTIYQIPLACSLYRKTVSKFRPYSFKEEGDEELLTLVDDEKLEILLGQRVYMSLENQQTNSRSLCYVFVALFVLDVLILITNILLIFSIYRYLIYRKKTQTRKLFRETHSQNEVDMADYTLTFLEFKKYTATTLLQKVDNKEERPEGKKNLPIFSKYPSFILRELAFLIADLFVIIPSPLLLLNPFRVAILLRKMKAKWSCLDYLEQVGGPSLRWEVFFFELLIVIDYIILCFAMISLISFWRWNYFFPEMRFRLRSDLSIINSERHRRYGNKIVAIEACIGRAFAAIFVDLLCLPVLIVLLPFFAIAFWRFPLLIKLFKISKARSFCDHRMSILQVGCLCLFETISLVPLAFIIVTLWRIPTMRKLLQLTYKRDLLENDVVNSNSVPLLEDQNNNNNEREVLIETENINEQPRDGLAPPEIQNPIPNVPETKQQIWDREKDLQLFEIAWQCTSLVFFDVIAFPFWIFIYLNHSLLPDFKKEVEEFVQRGAASFSGFYQTEIDIWGAKMKVGFESFLEFVFKIVLSVIFLVLMWRLPTFILLLRRDNLKQRTLPVRLQTEPRKQVAYLLCKCFWELILDITFLPFILLLGVTFWRAWPPVKQIYRYHSRIPVWYQIDQQRGLVLQQLGKGITDLYAILKLGLICVTLFRIPFLFMIIIKNRFPNSWIGRKLFPRHLAAGENPQYQVEKRLSWKKCLTISFKEWLRDIVCIPLGVIILVLGPWRIFTLISITASQVTRIPTQDMAAQGLRVFARRKEIAYLLWTVISADLPTVFKIIFCLVSFFGTPIILMTLLTALLNFGEYYRGLRSFVKEVDIAFKRTLNVLLKVGLALVILVLIGRIYPTTKRLIELRKKRKATKKERTRKYERQGPPQSENSISLSDLNWDVYGRICQFLTVEDLGHMSQVNKKFNALNQKDMYWEYQYKRDWSGTNHWMKSIENASYKQKCISAYEHQKIRRDQFVLTKEERDITFGTTFILFEEAVKSLRLIPHYLLIPMKGIIFLLYSIFGKNTQIYLGIRLSSFVDSFRSVGRYQRVNTYEQVATFRKIHYGLEFWLYKIYLLYTCDVGLVISWIFFLLLRLVNAGQSSPIVVRMGEENDGTINVTGTIPRNELREYQPRALRYPLYVLQFVWGTLFLATLLALVAVFPFLLIKYWDWPWYEAIFGPCWVLILQYAMVWNVFFSITDAMNHSICYFEPFKAISEPFALLSYILDTIWNNVAKPFLKFTHQCVVSICRGIYTGIAYLCSGLGHLGKFICKFISTMGKGVYQGYIGILKVVSRATLSKGLIGEIFLTFFALIWILWPVAIPFFLPSRIYFIPCGLVSMIFLVIAYKTIKMISTELEEQQNNGVAAANI